MKLTVVVCLQLAFFAICEAQLNPVTPDVRGNPPVTDDFITDDFVTTATPSTEPPSEDPTNTTDPKVIETTATDSPTPAATIATVPPNTLGQEQSNPGKSCNDIYQSNEATRGVSGKYWIFSPEANRAIEVMCNMELECDGSVGGWLEVVNFDASDDNTACPGSWLRVSSGCVGSNVGCSQAFFQTHKLKFHKVCGYVKGYQKGATDGFQPSFNNPSINGPYVDGVSLTVKPYPTRQHIWSYAAGLTDHGEYKYWNCPCATVAGLEPPSFVFDHYYCESGTSNTFSHGTYYTADPLWDGAGCNDNNNCCTRPGMPWFYRSFPAPLTDNLEARICRDQEHSNENIVVAEIALYIK